MHTILFDIINYYLYDFVNIIFYESENKTEQEYINGKMHMGRRTNVLLYTRRIGVTMKKLVAGNSNFWRWLGQL